MAEQQKPRKILVEATERGHYDATVREPGDRFYIHGHENFNPGWMVEVKPMAEKAPSQPVK